MKKDGDSYFVLVNANNEIYPRVGGFTTFEEAQARLDELIETEKLDVSQGWEIWIVERRITKKNRRGFLFNFLFRRRRHRHLSWQKRCSKKKEAAKKIKNGGLQKPSFML